MHAAGRRRDEICKKSEPSRLREKTRNLASAGVDEADGSEQPKLEHEPSA
jgi:hypothetical protein